MAAGETVRHLYSHARYGHDAYESRANCDWSIVAPPGHFVRLAFLTFELEPEPACGYDAVQVLGGLEGSAGDYGSFCGTKVREPQRCSYTFLTHLLTLVCSHICFAVCNTEKHIRVLERFYILSIKCALLIKCKIFRIVLI